jgi:energy-coupling factor transporter ATP-binding protein EcfA2
MSETETQSIETKGSENMVKDFFAKFDRTYRPIYFKNYQGSSYLSLSESGNERTLKINSAELDIFVVKTFRKLGFSWGANKNIITRIKDEMNALAIVDDKKDEVYIRVAGNTKGVVIDRGIGSKELIQILPGRKPKIITSSEFKFIRPAKQRDLPRPVFDDFDFDSFKRLFNFNDQDDALLLLAYILKSITPNSGPYPILILEGPQGSGKTTATTMIGKLIDPTEPSLFAPPKNEEDIKIQAHSSWLLTYDNLSYLNGTLTDAFCRVSTGGGMSSRKLYSDDEQMVYSIQRPVVFNGIEELGERPDFLDRAIILHTKPIPENSRKFSDSIWDPFNAKYDSLLGGIYCLLSEVLLLLPSIEAKNLPRMADYAKFGIALEKVLKLPEGTFMRAYGGHNREKLHKLFDSDPMCLFVEYMIDGSAIRSGTSYIGTAGELMANIPRFCKQYGFSPASMPSNPKSLKGRLARIKPVLTAMGIEYGEIPRSSNKRPFYLVWKDREKSPSFEEDLKEFLNPDTRGWEDVL